MFRIEIDASYATPISAQNKTNKCHVDFMINKEFISQSPFKFPNIGQN